MIALQTLLALALIVGGLLSLYDLARRLSPLAQARRQGQIDAQKYKDQRDLMDAYWTGFREEIYSSKGGKG